MIQSRLPKWPTLTDAEYAAFNARMLRQFPAYNADYSTAFAPQNSAWQPEVVPQDFAEIEPRPSFWAFALAGAESFLVCVGLGAVGFFILVAIGVIS